MFIIFTVLFSKNSLITVLNDFQAAFSDWDSFIILREFGPTNIPSYSFLQLSILTKYFISSNLMCKGDTVISFECTNDSCLMLILPGIYACCFLYCPTNKRDNIIMCSHLAIPITSRWLWDYRTLFFGVFYTLLN